MNNSMYNNNAPSDVTSKIYTTPFPGSGSIDISFNGDEFTGASFAVGATVGGMTAFQLIWMFVCIILFANIMVLVLQSVFLCQVQHRKQKSLRGSILLKVIYLQVVI